MNRNISIKFALIAAIFITMAAGSVASAADKTGLDRVRERGYLTVGTSPDYPPFESIDDTGKIVGFDIDLIEAVAKEMGLEVRLMTMGFDSIIIAVKNGQVDLGVSSFSVTEERKASVDFTTAYMTSSQVILTTEKSGVRKVEDLKGQVVAAAMGTTGAEAAKSIDGAVVKTLEDYNIAMMMLNNGFAKAVVLDIAIAGEYVEKRGFVMLEKPLQHEETAMIAGKGNGVLTEAVNAAMETVKKNGVFDALRKKWGI